LLAALAVLALVLVPRLHAQVPLNDNFANATVLAGQFGTVNGNTFNATIEPGEPFHYNLYRLRSVWFQWTAPASGFVTFDTFGSSYDTLLAAYVGTNVAALIQLASDDDSSIGLASQITFFANQGTTYHIAIDGFAGASGFYVLSWNQAAGPPAPQVTNAIEFASASFAVDEANPGFAIITVVSAGGFTNASTVDYYTADGSGLANSDYFSVSNTLTFLPGDTVKTFSVPIIDNSVQDSNRTVQLWLANPTGDAVLGNLTNSVLTIVDDETPAYVSPAGEFNVVWPDTPLQSLIGLFGFITPQYVVTENETVRGIACMEAVNIPDRSAKGAVIAVKRSAPASGRVLVDYYTTNGTAQAGFDYTPVSGTLQFDDNQMMANFVVPIIPTFTSNHVFFSVILANARPAPEEDPTLIVPTIGPTNTATVGIVKVNHPAFRVSIARATYRVDEYSSFSQGTTNVVLPGVTNFIEVDLILPPGGNVSATIAIGNRRYLHPLMAGSDYGDPTTITFDNTPYTDGTANIVNRSDFGPPLTYTATFTPSDCGDTILIPITPDLITEFNEDIYLEIVSTAPAGNIGPNRFANVTIVTDDQPAGAADREWNPEGVVYTNPRFYNTPGANYSVSAVAVQPDDKTLIGGYFTHVNSVSRNRVARYNFDGSLDATFNPGTGADGGVNALVLYPATGIGTNFLFANKILIGGGFTSYNGQQRNGIARLETDGTLDFTFQPGNGANGIVRAVALQNDGRILVAGDFTTFNDLNVNGIMRLNSDGSLDATFNPGFAANGSIWSVVVRETGTNRSILVAGDFTSFDTIPRNRIVQLTDAGAVDPGFDPGLGANGPIYAVAIQVDGKLVLGGSFSMYHTLERNNFARINADGSLDVDYNIGKGADDSVYTIVLQPDRKAIIGGIFTSFNGTRRMGLARIHTSGVLDTSFMDSAYNQFAGLPKTFSFDNPSFINAIALQADGDLMIGGSFTNLGGNLSVNHPLHTNSFGFIDRSASINGRTNVHNSGAHASAPFTRQDKARRFNVARIKGGYTPGPGNIEYDPASLPFTIDEHSGNLAVTLRRVDGRLGTAQAEPSTENNTAEFPLDFTSAATVLNWEEYNATFNAVFVLSPISVGYVGNRYFNIPILNDSLQEGDETLGLILSNTFGGITLSGEFIPLGTAPGHLDSSSAAIADDDKNPGIFNFSSTQFVTNEVFGLTVIEAVVTVIRTNGTAGAVTVDYLTRTNAAGPNPSGRFASAGTDYIFERGTLHFADGATSATFTISILNNPEVEFDEDISIVLTNATAGAKLPGGAATSVAQAVLTVVDDDFTPGRLQFSVLNFTNNENDVLAKVDVTRSGGNLGAMTVDFMVLNGIATTPADYLPPTNAIYRLSWNDNDNSAKSFYVPLVADGLVEGHESVQLRLVNPTVPGSLGSRTNATLWITDGDAYGVLSFSQVYYETDENGVHPTITVNRSGGSAGTISVNFATTPIVAAPLVDYRDTNGTLVFGPGEFTKTFTVPVIDNTVPDGDRNLQITLSNPTNGALGLITNVILNIVDNESINLAAGSIDTTFSLDAATDGAVYALLQQADGRIIMAGDFTHVSSVPRNHLARIKPGGTLDNTFDIGPGANDSIRALAMQSNGRLLIGGLFTSVNGTNRFRIARLSTDGTLDASFNPGAGADNGVFALAVQPNDKVLVGGAFSSFNGIVRPGLVRLNTNGVVDTSFATGAGFNGAVYAVAVQNDGKVIVGGDFISYNGVARTNILRLNANGTLDNTFSPALRASGAVRAIFIEPDGRIVFGGSFTNVSGSTRRHIARVDKFGVLDPNFLSTPANSGADSTVFAIQQQVDGRLIVAGDFKIFNGVTRNGITRINEPDGSTDPTINFGNGANAFVSAVIIQPDRRIVLGGGFTEYDDQPRQHIARIYGGSISGPGSIEFSSPQFVTSEAGTNAVVSVRRRGGTTGSVSASYATSNGSALAGRDYLTAAGTLNFPQGETRQVFWVPIITNSVADGDRVLNLLLSNFTGADGVTNGPQWFSSLLILDDESTVGFSALNYAVSESPVSSNATILLVRSGNTNSTVTVVAWTDTTGSATPGADYRATNVTVTFQPGERTKNFNIRILDDFLIELNETVSLLLSNVTPGIALGISNAVLTINDNEAAAGQFLFQTNNYVVDEFAGWAVVTVLRTNGFSGVVTVRLTTSDGTANALDYIGTNRVLTFGQGETAMSLAFPIINDGTAEPDETINLTLSQPTGNSSILTPNAIVTIADDEIVPSYVGYLTNNFFVSEGAGFATITVVRTNSRRGDVAVDFSVSNGSATAGLDYVITNGSILFTNNEVSKTFTVPVLEDILGEGDETVRLNLGNLRATNTTAFYGAPTSTLVIQDNDTTLHFSGPAYSAVENASNAVITVIRSGVTNTPVSATYLTRPGGTAIAGLDYRSVTGTVAWAANDALPKTFFVPLIDNTGTNVPRTVNLALTNVIGANAYLEAPSNAVLTITDNDVFNPVAGVFDTTFNGNVGANGAVHSVAFDSQQRLLVGGEFSRIHGQYVNRVARLTTNGAVDVTFNVGSGADNTVFAVAPVADGVYAGGAFTNFNGLARNGLVRLGTNGNVDLTFNIGTGANAPVRAIATAGGQVFIAGDFTTYNGQAATRVARLDAAGVIDNTFLASANAAVRALAVQADGRVIIGGDFTVVGGFAFSRLARLNIDGTIDSTFVVGLGADATVRSVVMQPDGKVLVGGDFLTFNGSPRSRIVRLNTDGSVDVTFDPGAGFDGPVRGLAVQVDGRVLAVGSFAQANGNPFNRLARLNADGSVDTLFAVGTGANATVNSVATFTVLPPPTCVPPIPAFMTFDFGGLATNVAVTNYTENCVNFGGVAGATFITVTNGFGLAAQMQAFGGSPMQIDLGGRSFTLASINFVSLLGSVVVQSSSGGLAVVPSAGTFFFDSTFADVTSVQIFVVNGSATLDDILIIPPVVPVPLPTDLVAVGGEFTQINGQPRGRVALLDSTGAVSSQFDPSVIPARSVYALDVYTNLQPSLVGKILAGGDFAALVGVEGINHLGRLNIDGSLDTTFNLGVGPNGAVRAIAIQPDGKAVIGGLFTTYDYIARAYLARVNADGTLDNAFNFGAGLDNSVLALALQPDGRILAAGNFTTVYGVPRGFVARMLANGTVDPSFTGGADGPVRALALQPDGKIVIGGDFTSVNGVPRNRIARLNSDGSLDASFNPGGGVTAGVVNALALTASGEILVGGSFQSINGNPTGRLAKLSNGGALDGSFAIGSGADDSVNAIRVQPDGRILVAGNFVMFNGQVRNHLARLNGDGTFDAAVNFGTGANAFISAIALQGYDNKIVVGGGFTTFDGQPRVAVARIFGGDNTGAGALQFAAAAWTVNESSNSVTLAVVRTGGTFGPAAVNFNTIDGTATAPAHYTPASGTLNFAPAETVKYITVPVSDDAVTNADRSFSVALSGVVNATLGTPVTATVTIIDNDSVIGFSGIAYTVNENGGAARVTVSRSGGTAGVVTVDFATGTNGTATPFFDFTPRFTTLIFNPGVRVMTVDVPVTDDLFNEFNETVSLALLNATGPATLALTNATLTIVENDAAAGVLSFATNNFYVSEDAVTATITVIRTNGHSGNVTVAFTTGFGTASNTFDFMATNGLVTFGEGQTNATFTIRILDDVLLEGNETLSLTLFSASGGATVGAGTATLTIVENDRSGDFMFSQPVYTVNENGGTATITVLRTNGNLGTASVIFQTSGGTATPPGDFTARSNLLTFVAGQTSTNITIPVIDDAILEGTETVTLLLSGNTNILTPSASLQIIDNELGVTFDQAGYAVTEGLTSAFITLVRTGDTNRQVSVRVNTADVSTSAGQDYLALPPTYTVTFAPGQTNLTFLIGIFDDTLSEGDEVLNMTLSSPSASPAGLVALGPVQSTTLTILDDDAAFGFTSAVYDVDEAAGLAQIAIVRYGSLAAAASVDFGTFDGTATAGFFFFGDYTSNSTRVSFPAGVATQFVTVTILDDTTVENNETVLLVLANPSAGSFLAPQSTAVINILDNDSAFAFTQTNYVVNEKATNAAITIVRTGLSTTEASVTFRTTNGTAGAADYGTISTLLMWGVDDVSPRTVLVPIVDDGVLEGRETVGLILENPTNATIDFTFGFGVVLTIVDDAGAIAFSSASYSVAETDGSAVLNLVRSGGTNGVVTVNWTASGGSATAGVDYSGTSGTVVFASGESQKPVIIPLLHDLDTNGNFAVEGLETLNVSLSSATGGARVGSPATTILRIFDSDSGIIVSSGSALAAESFAPGNGVIESNEIVTLHFALRNNGTVNDTVTATLVYANGVTPANPAAAATNQFANYGTLIAGGDSAYRPFTFKAVGTNGTRITATLLITNSAGRFLGDIAFSYVIGQQQIPFANAGVISVTTGTGAPYPSALTVSGVNGPINKLTVTLFNVSHAFPDDLDILLVGPAGQRVLLMSDAGGGNLTAMNNVTLTFDDAAAAFIPDATQITSGTYRPANYSVQTDPFPAPAPAGQPIVWNTNLSAFNGTDPNGTWSLFVVDDSTAQDTGSIAGGWSLTISTAETVTPSADLSLAVTATPDPVGINAALTYTVAVTNRGPGSASAVSVTNSLPPGTAFVSSPTGGGTHSAGVVVFNFGTLAVNAGATGTFVVTVPGVPGTITNTAVAGTTQSDLNGLNNLVFTKTAVTNGVPLPPPPLFSARKNGQVVLTWQSTPNVVLETKAQLGAISWNTATNAVVASNGVSSATVPVNGPGSSFFRLKRNP
jgi:uncharacterized delta-60 repeat protein/uncharacterized repeat protein (TIGR01451 family)